ncbi:MAG: zinc ribbon domain-containing protein [Gemmatimonadota bacterium]|nr:MAG: zinc ribbon domain-containing protein [Gemmatimonadota bacterium]
MLELIAGVIVAIVAVALVLEPLFSARGAEPVVTSPTDEIDFSDIEESDSAKVQALLALKEIEFDRATGKLSDEDYAMLKAKYSKVAIAAIEAEEQETLDMAAEDVAEELIRRAAAGRGTVCPSCGPRPEAEAAFCSNCGRTLSVAPSQAAGFCGECGTALPNGAKFCAECGSKAVAPV